MVQEFAHAALRQGAAGVDRAAALGAFGENPRMIHQGLVRLFGSVRGAPEFTWIPVPTTKGETFVPVLLPHRFFASLYSDRRTLWETMIRGPPGAAQVFWDHLASTTIVRDHPHLPEPHRGRIIPLGMHGDGGPFTKQDSLFVLSWNSLVGGGEGFARRFLSCLGEKG